MALVVTTATVTPPNGSSTRSLTISRNLVGSGLPDLQLWAPPTYLIVGDSFGPGAQVWRRETVTSPYVHGRFLVQSTKAEQIVPLVIQVLGTDGSDLGVKVGDLLDAFSQPAYTLTEQFSGTLAAWTCEMADYSVGPGGALNDLDLFFHAAEITLAIPRAPKPLAGRF